jgi:hypothetical protein
MEKHFHSVLWLDDMRQPLIVGFVWVKSYVAFVDYLTTNPMPELICFDHDLAPEHYPIFQQFPGLKIPYGSYKEKTGLECARFIIEHALPLTYWSIHTQNPEGRRNLENELRRYRPQGELRGLEIPFLIVDLWEETDKT